LQGAGRRGRCLITVKQPGSSQAACQGSQQNYRQAANNQGTRACWPAGSRGRNDSRSLVGDFDRNQRYVVVPAALVGQVDQVLDSLFQ
jgi:hypothetical protein